jgi:hypothetical protein
MKIDLDAADEKAKLESNKKKHMKKSAKFQDHDDDECEDAKYLDLKTLEEIDVESDFTKKIQKPKLTPTNASSSPQQQRRQSVLDMVGGAMRTTSVFTDFENSSNQHQC